VLPPEGLVIEVAAGAGEHAVFFAAQLPDLRWQPTDVDPQALASITAWREHTGLPNVRPPRRLDATDWPDAELPDAAWLRGARAVVCINMIHISPWAATEGLFAGAGRLLPPGGRLITYGAYRVDGAHTAPSNARFEEWLKARDPAYGVRDLEEISRLAERHDLCLVERVQMPANNSTLVFDRQ